MTVRRDVAAMTHRSKWVVPLVAGAACFMSSCVLTALRGEFLLSDNLLLFAIFIGGAFAARRWRRSRRG